VYVNKDDSTHMEAVIAVVNVVVDDFVILVNEFLCLDQPKLVTN